MIDPLDTASVALLVIDVQERLLGAMDEEVRDRHLGRMIALTRGCRALGVPILCTEQYPAGLGTTVPPLLEALEETTRLPKTTFSCMGDERVAEAMAATGRTQWLIVGMETHICVFQTVRDLQARGHEAHVVADGCLSRHRLDHAVGLERMGQVGAQITTTELALFELLGEAGGDTFKTISHLIR